jgi:hypothetical protein
MENRLVVPTPPSLLVAHGMWEVEHWRKGRLLGRELTKNLICNEGLNHILNVVLHGTTPVSPWYMAIFEGNYTPVATVTAATVTADSTESTAYDESTRVEYAEAAASSQSTTNSASKATFTISASKTIYGAFLASASAKSATTGTLLAIARFATSRAVIDNDVLTVTYTITATSA